MKIKGPEKPEKKKKEKAVSNKGKENASKSLTNPGDLRKFFTPPPGVSKAAAGTLSNVKSFGKTNNVFKGNFKVSELLNNFTIS